MNVADDNKEAEATLTGEALRTVARLFGELQLLGFACCDVRSSTQCHILTTLDRGGNQTLTALASGLNLDKAWLSRSTDAMVEDGLLVKAPHPGDRRALQLQLTAAGRQAAAALNAELNGQAQRVLDRLLPEDRAHTVRLLTALQGALQAELQLGLPAPRCATAPGGEA